MKTLFTLLFCICTNHFLFSQSNIQQPTSVNANGAAQPTCGERHPELEDFAPLPGQAAAVEKSAMNSIFSGTVQYPGGAIQYSKMLIYDPITFEVISSDWVCNGGVPFNISVPPGIYNVYYRPFQGGAQPYEVLNVNLTANLDTILVLTPYTTPEYMDDLSWSKVAIFADNNETVSITAYTNPSTTIDEIYWFNEFNTFINPALPFSQAKIRLTDDGLGNDLVAGDGIFTSIPIKYNTSNGLYRSGYLSAANLLFFQVDDAVNGVQGYRYNGPVYRSLGLVSPTATAFAPLSQVSANVYRSDYIMNIVRASGYSHISDAQTLYSVYPDSFDFINIFYTNYTGANPSTNFHFGTKNTVTGIGTPIFNDNPQYGSAGQLQGINVFPSLSVEPPLNHEVLHQWSQFMNTLFNGSSYGSHNGFTTIHGVHGGIIPPLTILSPTSVSFSQAITYGYSSDQKDFSNLELYLMGAVDTNSIADHTYTLYDPIYQGGNVYSVSSISDITPQGIVSTYGYRSPSPLVADSDFKTANIVISDAPLTAAAVAFYTFLARAWADEIPENFYKSFEEAAQSNATMTTLLPVGCTALASPANGAVNVPAETALSWPAAQVNPVGYKLRVGTTPGGTQILNNFDAGNVLTFNPPGDFPYNTTIYVTVTAYNAVGNASGCMEKNFTVEPEPLVPDCTQLSAPLNGAVNVPITASLSWLPANGNPSGYRLDVGTTPGGTQILNNFDVGNVTTFNPPGDFPYNTVIYVKIIPYKAGGNASGCVSESFTTQFGPPACTVLSNPVNGATGVLITSGLSWLAAAGNPTGYRLDVGTTAGGTQILHNFNVGNVTTYDPPGNFPPNTVIYVKIKPYNTTGSSTGCAEESFVTENESCLTTFFNANNGSHGNMFDVTNTSSQSLQINSFEVNIASSFLGGPGGTGTVHVYYTTTASTFLGNQSNAGAWTLLGTATVPMQGANQPSQVTIGGLVLAPGQTKGLYVTTNGGSVMHFTNGNSAAPVTDGNLSIDLTNNPLGMTYPFGPAFAPRRWNGTICYDLISNQPPACTSLSEPANGATNVPTNIGLTWLAATGSPTGYRLDVGTTPGGTQILNNFDVGNVTTYNPPGEFPASSMIYVKIKPYNGAGPATGCPEESFGTAICTPYLTVVSMPVAAGVYRSMGELWSFASSVASGTSVTFTSDESVWLEHTFEVELGAVFEINIQGCTNFQPGAGDK